MKHIFGLVLLICMVSSLFATDFRVAMGLDLMGESLSSEGALLVGVKNKVGISMSGQATKTTNNIRYGFGMDFQLPRKHQSMPMGWSSDLSSSAYIPFYGLLSYSFPAYRGFSPEFIAQLGYSIPFYSYRVDESPHESTKYSADGGPYTGLGIGMRHHDIDVQLLYRVNRSTVTTKEYYYDELDITNHVNNDARQWYLSLGCRFMGAGKKAE